MTVKDTLRNCSLFSGVGGEDLERLAPAFSQMTAMKGDVILKEGEHAPSLYLIEEGRVSLQMTLERPDGSSTGPTPVASLGPGEAFGWLALIDLHLNTLSATVVEPTRLLHVEGSLVQEMLSLNKAMGFQIMGNLAKLLGERLGETREALVFQRSWVHYQQQLPEGTS